MRNIIFGAIGTLWGAAVIIYSFVGNKPDSGGAYGAGQIAGTIFGFVFFVAGIYYLIQGIRTVNQPKVTMKKKKKKRVVE